MSRCFDTSFTGAPVYRLAAHPLGSLTSSLNSASSSSVLLASSFAHVDATAPVSDLLLFRMNERGPHQPSAMDSLKMRTFPHPPQGEILAGGTLGKFPRTTAVASNTLGRGGPPVMPPVMAPVMPQAAPQAMVPQPQYHPATNNNKGRHNDISDAGSSSGEEDERHESTPFLHAIQKRIPNGVRGPEDYDPSVLAAYPEPDELAQVSTTAATSLRRGAGVGAAGGDPQRRIVHIPPPPSEPPPSTPRSSLHMGSGYVDNDTMPPRPHPSRSQVPQLPSMVSAGSPVAALPVSVPLTAQQLYSCSEDPLMATPPVAVLPVSSGQPMELVGYPPNAFQLPPVPNSTIRDYNRPMYSPPAHQPLITPQHVAAVLDQAGRVVAYDSGGTYHSLSKRQPYASASVRSQETTSPYHVDEPKSCWGRFRTGRWCTARNLAMFVLVLVIVLLLAFAIYYGILSRWLERRWKEKFAQDPAVLGLFDPSKPPPYIKLDPSVPHTIALTKLGVWSRRWQSKHAQFVQFNFSLPPRTVVGVYLRHHTVPTIVQYNYFDQISSRDYHPTAPLATRVRRSTAGGMDRGATPESLVHYLQPGLWFIALVNDQPADRRLNLTVFSPANNRLGCRNQCSNRGICYKDTTCKCFPRFKGEDCSIREQVKVCNGRGHYVRGECKCHSEWKGKECETLWNECLDPTCSSNGQCVQGICKCYPGYSGPRCEKMTCLSPNCTGNGICQRGRCRCFAGFNGPSCELKLDSPLPQSLTCSGHGTWNSKTKTCQCVAGYTGNQCEKVVCPMPCLEGTCVAGKCECKDGWEGAQCDRLKCDPRCYEHGKCLNGTCLCSKGWNGKHCSLDGCPNGCSNHGNCLRFSVGWHCQCTNDWKGKACEYPREMKCSDGRDNDGDKLVDCGDPDCCLDPHCVGKRDSGGEDSATQSCSLAVDPTHVLLSKKTVQPTDSFWDRIKFLVDAESVQTVGKTQDLNPDLVSVIRGIVRLEDGSPLRGCRVMDKRNLVSGYTLSRANGHFDLVVNGGSLVELEFARFPTERFSDSYRIFAPVNEFVHVGVLIIRDKQNVIRSLVNSSRTCHIPSDSFNLLRPVLHTNWQASAFASCLSARASVCKETGVLRQSVPLKGTRVKLVYTSTWAAWHESGLWIGMTGREIPKGLAEVHLVVSVAGQILMKQFEADPNLSFVFTWNKRDVYGQKLHGLVATTVKIGYLYKGCVNPVWEKRVAYLPGCDMSASDIGGWNLDVHHVYNWQYGIVYRGDGSHLYLPMQPWRLRPLIGNGFQPRDQNCETCSGVAFVFKQVLSPTALASDKVGNIYILDGDHLRRINPRANYIYMTGKMPGKGSQTGEYYMTMNPANETLVVSDAANRQLVMVSDLHNPRRKGARIEVIASGLTYPKGIAYNLEGDMYLADGRAIRVVYLNKSTEHVIGRSVNNLEPWRPLACGQSVKADEMLLQWPTALVFDPDCTNLFFLDGSSVYRLNMATRLVTLVVGRPLNCPPVPDPAKMGGEEAPLAINAVLKKPNDLAFAPNGDLYIGERYAVRLMKSDGRLYNFAGDPDKPCDTKCPVVNTDRLARDVRFLMLRAITVNVSGEVIIADPASYRVHVATEHRTVAAHDGHHTVVSPDTREVYTFNSYGQHLRTFNALTNTVSHSFEYRVNDINGWLKRVIAGNSTVQFILRIRRDIRSRPQELITPQGLVYKPRLDSQMRLVGLLAPDNQVWGFDYDSNDLLINMESPDGHATWFTYDETMGYRLSQIISSSGFIQRTASWDNTSASGVSALQIYADGIGLTSRGGLAMDLPAAKTRVLYSLHKYPLQDGVYPMLNARLAQTGALRHNATWAYVLDEKLQPATISKQLRVKTPTGRASKHDDLGPDLLTLFRSNRKSLLVNGDLVYQVLYQPPVQGSRLASEVYQARDGKTKLFIITYSSTHQPLGVYLPKNLQALVTLKYNPVGILEMIKMDKITHKFKYDKLQRLELFTLSEGKRWTYHYKGKARKPYLVQYPSGSQYSLVFGAGGNLRHISSATNHVQTIERLTLIDRFRVMYRPWSGTAPNSFCMFDFLPVGSLKSFIYPSYYRRYHYLYTSERADKVAAMIAGSYKAEATYHPSTGLLTQLSIRDRVHNFRGTTTIAYSGSLPVQLRISWNLRGLALLDGHVKLHYDDRFRVTAIESNFRPGKFNFALRTTYRESSSGVQYNLNEGQFEIDVEFGQTLVRHRGVVWTYKYDPQRRLTSAHLVHSGMESRTRVVYGSINRPQLVTHEVQSGASSSQTSHQFLYDVDARLQLIKDTESGRTIEQFNYQANSRLKYFEQNGVQIPVKYDSRGLLQRFDNFLYKFDVDGFLESRRPFGSSAKRNSPKTEKFYFNARGLLTGAEGPNYRLLFFYDAYDRLVIRTDLYKRKNTLQFFYTDLSHPHRLSHVINHQTGKMLSFLYEPVLGFLYAFGVGEDMYYVHCDHHGSPMVVYNRHGRVQWRVSYSTSGHPTSRVADIWLPLGYRGAFYDETLRFAWLNNGRRLYDTHSGHWMSPDWMDTFDRLSRVTVYPDIMDAFTFMPGVGQRRDFQLDAAHVSSPDYWLHSFGFRPDQWLPDISGKTGAVKSLSLDLPVFRYPVRDWEQNSAYRCAFKLDWDTFSSLRLFPEVQLVVPTGQWQAQPGIFALDPMFGLNITLTVENGLVQVMGTPQALDREGANQMLAIILFNNSMFIPYTWCDTSGVQHYYFSVEPFAEAETDLFRLDFRKTTGSKETKTGVNITSTQVGRRFTDVRLRKSMLQYNLRYGVTAEAETARVKKLIEEKTADSAWKYEATQAKLGRRTGHAWTDGQANTLANAKRLKGYTSKLAETGGKEDVELMSDPSLIKLLPK